MDIGPVGDTDGDHGADAWVRQCPVGDGVLEEVRVGDDGGDAVVSLDVCGAGTDFEDLAGLAVDGDDLVDLYGSLEHQDEARDEVVHDVLGTEADAQRERPAEDCEDGERDLCDLQGDDGCDDEQEVVEDGLDRAGGSFVDLHAGEYFFADPAGDELGEDDAEDEGEECDDELIDEDLGFADGKESQIPEMIDIGPDVLEEVGIRVPAWPAREIEHELGV